MTETGEAPPPGGDAGSAGVGEQLRRARESRSLTIQQVAQSLHLDVWILEALEDERFRDIGAPVFVKGHLRKFALEVGADPDAILEAYYRSGNTPETPGLVTDALARPGNGGAGRWPLVAAAGAAVLILAALFWFFWSGGWPGAGDTDESSEPRGAQAAATRPATPVIEPRTEPVSRIDQRLSDDDAAGGPESVEVQTAGGDTAPAATEPPASVQVEEDADPPRRLVVPGDGEIAVTIRFANESWVEIYDADNRRLFFDLARADTTRTVSGAPPVQILLGNAEGAEVSVDGVPFQVPASARRGKTARFTVP